MPDVLCIGPCCVDRLDGDRPPRQAEPGALICRWGLARLRRDLQASPALMSWLMAHVERSGSTGERVSGSREAPVPVRLDVLCMIHDGAVPLHGEDDDQVGPPSIPSTLKAWAWLICEHRGLTYPVTASVIELAELLLRHAEWAAGRDFVADMMHEIGRLRRCAYGLAPWGVHVQRLGLPCWGCGSMGTMTRTAGEKWVECAASGGGCGRLWSLDEHDALIAATASRLPIECPACRVTGLLRVSRAAIVCDTRLDGCGRKWTQADLTNAIALTVRSAAV
ncbi:hypothetical protein [Spongiactinospora sp. TRM90649]|uniref:hypothetical protein n=1 Tax=Spongiactinospora sp. TRM90649 TaxID=3031114 RepID=UPI0023F88FE4|nr:hypothetical protein [Spongiactinospora sp. TRM90649]MDF5756581.1 hypothetical protein [Spongiactinospora sp. TRM90649]